MPKRQETVKVESLDGLHRTPFFDAVRNGVQTYGFKGPGGYM